MIDIQNDEYIIISKEDNCNEYNEIRNNFSFFDPKCLGVR